MNKLVEAGSDNNCRSLVAVFPQQKSRSGTPPLPNTSLDGEAGGFKVCGKHKLEKWHSDSSSNESPERKRDKERSVKETSKSFDTALESEAGEHRSSSGSRKRFDKEDGAKEPPQL